MFNHTQFAAPPRKRSLASQLLSGGFAALSLVVLLFASQAQAQAPVVGTPISNQASATYTDTTGTQKTALSNLVTTTVTQVASLDLTTDGTATVPPGGTAYLPHTLTNLGNGADTFDLALANAANKFSSIQLFPDADGNGVADSATPLCATPVIGSTPLCTSFTTPSLAPNATYKFIVALQVPMSATAASPFDTAVVTAKSVFETTMTKSNTDTVNVTNGAAFNVSKQIDIASGASSPLACTGTDYTGTNCIKVKYTLTYINTGAKGNLYLKDTIGSGATAGMEYIFGTALWSNSATALTEGVGGDVTGIDFQVFNGASALTGTGTGTIEAVIKDVPPNTSGTITFSVGIKSTALAGTSSTTNKALYDITTFATVATAADVTTPKYTTNLAPYAVGQVYSVVANNSSTVSTDGDGTSTYSATNNDVVLQKGKANPAANTATPGTTLVFENYIWNTSSSSDTFDITYDTSTLGASGRFPLGTTFELFKSDGSTTLTDSNGGSGAADTGPVSAGTAYKVVVKAIIPPSACSPTCPTGPFTLDIKATSITDSTKFNSVFDQLSTLVAPTVDLTNSAGGNGATSASANGDLGTYVASSTTPFPTTTKAVAAGASASFDLFVKNTGNSADNYDLQYSANDSFNATLPQGWSVQFQSGSCSSGTGVTITNTGNIASNAQTNVCAVVKTPANEKAGTTNIFFKAISGATQAFDIKVDAVTVKANPVVTLTPAGSGQIYPGGSIVYKHLLTNTGNTTCAGDFTFSLANVSKGWQVAVYQDNNSDGLVDNSSDTLLASYDGTGLKQPTNLITSLNVGSNSNILVKVIAPAGAASGDIDNIKVSVVDNATTTISGKSYASCTTGVTGGVYTNDSTLVITGQLRLEKYQAVVACGTNPTSVAASSFVQTNLSAGAGKCIAYKIKATNEGTTNVSTIELADTPPTYTSYNNDFICDTATKSPASPSVGYTDVLKCTLATMTPRASRKYVLCGQNKSRP